MFHAGRETEPAQHSTQWNTHHYQIQGKSGLMEWGAIPLKNLTKFKNVLTKLGLISTSASLFFVIPVDSNGSTVTLSWSWPSLIPIPPPPPRCTRPLLVAGNGLGTRLGVGHDYQLLALNQGSSSKFMSHSFGVARQNLEWKTQVWGWTNVRHLHTRTHTNMY